MREFKLSHVSSFRFDQMSTFTDGCDLTSIYSVCVLWDISECTRLDKETRQRKSLCRELDDESSAGESLDESSISIKSEIRSENTELELTSDFSIPR